MNSNPFRQAGTGTFLVMVLLASSAGCHSVDRSRALDDGRVPAITIAAQVCSNCHGIKGISTSPNFPILAAQSADYLEAQLKAFKGHGRSDPAGFEYMWGVSSRLSEQQIAGLSRYFSEQLPAPGRSIDPVREKLGQAIYADGIGAAGVPACAACHGAKGEGMAAFPRLAGQHADYVAKQLTVFQRTEERPDGVIMKAVTHALGKEDIMNLAAFVQSIDPGANQPF